MTQQQVWNVQFVWLKPIEGHTWRVCADGERRLVPNSGGWRGFDPKAREGRVLYVPPLGLFREFARLPWSAKGATRERAINSFADKHGDILAQPQEGHLILGQKVKKIRMHATMETWCLSIQRMRRAIQMWDQIKSDRGWYKNPTHRMMLTEELIRNALRDTETPSCATPYITSDLKIIVHPINLLAQMWLTFARVVSGEIEERACELCGDRIYIGRGPGLKRADKTTCSIKCRKRKERT
jgi:hypothetical protein